MTRQGRDAAIGFAVGMVALAVIALMVATMQVVAGLESGAFELRAVTDTVMVGCP